MRLDEQLGKYVLIERIGEGGMAEVYKALHPRLNRLVAVKRLHPHFARETEFLKRFEREASAVARLRHPHIVQVFDFDVAAGPIGPMPYMVMEYIAGPTLKAKLTHYAVQQEILSPLDALRIIEALASALDYAHRLGMVHHDVKPANVMLTPEGQVVLADFGLAHLRDDKDNSDSQSSSGTPAYIAPEQALGQRGDLRSDVYALGIVLYEIVTGRTPFTGDSAMAVILQHVSTPPPPPRTLNPEVSEALERVILCALAKAPEDRHQTAGDLALALRDALDLTSMVPVVERVSLTDHTLALTAPPACPYRGLFAFGEADAPFFFGREAFTERLSTAVQTAPLTAVIGPSGSGKSSVVYAGLLPMLRQASALRAAQGRGWLIADFRPGGRPFQALAGALVPLLDAPATEIERLAEIYKLAEALQSGLFDLHAIIERIHEKNPEVGRILLVADQFEEVFTLCPDPETQRRFLDVLLGAPRAALLLTLRADFMGQALAHRAFADAMQDGTLILGPMTRPELQRAIENPARKQGYAFKAGLVERLLTDVGHEPGNLPLLEFALTALWERPTDGVLTHAAYEEIGHVEGALARYADEVYARLALPEQALARQVFVQMVRPGEGTEDTRRVAARTELDYQSWALVRQLADARLVVTDRDAAGSETAEVVHEALLRSWERLRTWMDSDRRFRAWQERLRVNIHQWDSMQRDEDALLRGAPLAEAEGWLNERATELSAIERAFIASGQAVRRQRAEAQEAQRQHELEAAHQLAETERQRAEEQIRSATELRRRARALALVLAISILFALVAVYFSFQFNDASQRNASLAHQKEDIAATAQAAATAAQTSANSAQSAAGTAQAASTSAVAQSNARATAEVDAYAQARRARIGEVAAQAINLLDQNPDLALLLSAETYQRLPLWNTRNSLLTAIQSSATLEPVGRFVGHTAHINRIAFSPNGQLLVSASNDKTIRIWSLATGQALGPPLSGHAGVVKSIAFSPDGSLLASASNDFTVRLWDMARGQAHGQPLSGHTGAVNDIAISPDGRLLASASDDMTVRLWDVASGQAYGQPLSGHVGRVRTVAFSPDGQMLASGGDDNLIRLWDVTSGQPIGTPLVGHGSWIMSVVFSPDGKRLASGSLDHTIRLWDIATGQPIGFPLKGHTDGVLQVVFSPDGSLLASASAERMVILWDLATGRPINGPILGVASVAFSPDGNFLAAPTNENVIRVWRITAVAPLSGHTADVTSVAFSPDGQTLASASQDSTVRLWDVRSGQMIGAPFSADAGGVNAVAFNPNGQFVAAAGADTVVWLWNLHGGKPVSLPLNGHTAAVTSVAFSPDGHLLASASVDHTIRLWNGLSGEPIGQPLNGHTEPVTSIVFSPDGRTLASASADKSVYLWDMHTGLPLGQPLTGHTGAVLSVAFSPNGTLLASGSEDRTIRLWDAHSGQPVGEPLVGHTSWVTSLAFSPDGTLLASVSVDRTLRLWDVESGQAIGLPFTGHGDYVMGVAFSPDGRVLASASNDDSVRLWPIGAPTWGARACEAAGRNLTQVEWARYFPGEAYHVTCAEWPGAPEPVP